MRSVYAVYPVDGIRYFAWWYIHLIVRNMCKHECERVLPHCIFQSFVLSPFCMDEAPSLGLTAMRDSPLSGGIVSWAGSSNLRFDQSEILRRGRWSGVVHTILGGWEVEHHDIIQRGFVLHLERLTTAFRSA
jgi:hypothetical protein